MSDITKPIELDYLYNASDKLYMQFARSCGVSHCAYWMLYDLIRTGGTAPLTRLCDSWSYSKQTINSALKTLESRGLIKLSFCEGSRRNKAAELTDAGRAFAARNIEPAMQAEERAFRTLTADERQTLLSVTRRYANALDMEFNAMREEREALEADRDRPQTGEGTGTQQNEEVQ